MKKIFMLAAIVAASASFVACSSDKNDTGSNTNQTEQQETVTTAYLVCVEQMLDGCSDIANEVGNAKIGDPFSLYQAGKTQEALYAVESWYSWHSRDDYSNNILSIRNTYYGSVNGKVNENSISAMIAKQNSARDTEVKEAIQAAYDAILAIPQPFRNNINSSEAQAAMKACTDLDEVLQNLKGYIQKNPTLYNDKSFQKIVENYVDVVILPTYKNLLTNNQALDKAVAELAENPTDAAYEKAAEAWLTARQPWETSEAFLFGPVDALGLDPNMDSWPLDQDAIDNILSKGDFSSLEYGEGAGDEQVEAAQSVRGFHTLEYLLFLDGKPRQASGDAIGTNWLKYMRVVSTLLCTDATDLNNAWNTSYEGGKSYAELFKTHNIQ